MATAYVSRRIGEELGRRTACTNCRAASRTPFAWQWRPKQVSSQPLLGVAWMALANGGEEPLGGEVPALSAHRAIRPASSAWAQAAAVSLPGGHTAW